MLEYDVLVTCIILSFVTRNCQELHVGVVGLQFLQLINVRIRFSLVFSSIHMWVCFLTQRILYESKEKTDRDDGLGEIHTCTSTGLDDYRISGDRFQLDHNIKVQNSTGR